MKENDCKSSLADRVARLEQVVVALECQHQRLIGNMLYINSQVKKLGTPVVVCPSFAPSKN
ncbi:hypothetical protein [Rosistilla oblonga]|uniref:hypothetical protein n=1 Tax=Rosistilla oblonga TaxID=2527990 RepID=UPI003A971FCF